ncbi:hypothetical protein METHPM2_420005 [Pseudomonas sp. PM2]
MAFSHDPTRMASLISNDPCRFAGT